MKRNKFYTKCFLVVLVGTVVALSATAVWAPIIQSAFQLSLKHSILDHDGNDNGQGQDGNGNGQDCNCQGFGLDPKCGGVSGGPDAVTPGHF